jgi:5-methylcytosine-specific restriction enzyme A
MNEPWRTWYGLRRWRRRAALQLRMYPLCCMCEAQGKVVPATVADHIHPHRGDERAFWCAPLQSLCKRCHDSCKQSIEKLGFSKEVDADGWPISPDHPANRDNHNKQRRR